MKAEFDRAGPVLHLLLRYTQALITQMSQTAVFNRDHTLDQQLCRWLLLSLDRLRVNELAMTQELIANMLGVRREGVTEAAVKLQEAGLISYVRGRITVPDRAGLESALVNVMRLSNASTIACFLKYWRHSAPRRCPRRCRRNRSSRRETHRFRLTSVRSHPVRRTTSAGSVRSEQDCRQAERQSAGKSHPG